VALIVSSDSPQMLLAVSAAVVIVFGGICWSATATYPPAVRGLVIAVPLLAARSALGQGGALLVGLLVALGAWLRLRLIDGVRGLALFAAAIVVLGGATPQLLLCFWLLGLTTVVMRCAWSRVRCRLAARAILADENARSTRLGPEN
jgi:hypothetical protein